MQTELTDQHLGADKKKSEKYFGATDAIFVLVAIVVAVMVAHLGYATWLEGVSTETTKEHGQQVADWLAQHGSLRAAGKTSGVTACDEENSTWGACLAALTSESGPFAGLVNVTQKNGSVFSDVCDREQANTHGAILIEKGVPKEPAGSGFNYAPMADSEVLAGPLALKVTICGRGFSLIPIKEVHF